MPDKPTLNDALDRERCNGCGLPRGGGLIHKAKGSNVVTVIQEGRAHRGWNFRVTMLVALLVWAVLFLAFFGLLALIGWAT